jgi:hypothetical protein
LKIAMGHDRKRKSYVKFMGKETLEEDVQTSNNMGFGKSELTKN